MAACLAAAFPRGVEAADPLSDLPFAVGDNILFDEETNDGRDGEQGHWRVTRGRMVDGQIALRVVIDPPPHLLEVESGPAVLFAGIEAFGGSGDVGYTVPMDALATRILPACDDDDCRYVTDVSLPTDEIPGALRRLARVGDLEWITVNMTLVRTFGSGTWLQVLPLLADGAARARAGRLGAIRRVGGRVYPFGLFPADRATPVRADRWMFTSRFDYGPVVERLRQRVPDRSDPIRTVKGHVAVDLAASCARAAHLTLHDTAGNRVFDTPLRDERRIEGTFRIPVSGTWRLTLHDGSGIDFARIRGWGIRIGPIESDGGPIDVRALVDCDAGAGWLIADDQNAAPPSSRIHDRVHK
jgi:hypothetical protein